MLKSAAGGTCVCSEPCFSSECTVTLWSDFQVALEGAEAGSLRLHVNSEFQGREGHM